MTSIATAEYRNAPTTPETRIYSPGLPSRTGSLLSGLDKTALVLVTIMALGPLAMAAIGAHVIGA